MQPLLCSLRAVVQDVDAAADQLTPLLRELKQLMPLALPPGKRHRVGRRRHAESGRGEINAVRRGEKIETAGSRVVIAKDVY